MSSLIRKPPTAPTSASADQSNEGPDARFSRDALLNDRKQLKAANRWNQLIGAARRIRPDALTGPVLDFGCGAGYFLHEGMQRGFDIWGVDRLASKAARYHRLLDCLQAPNRWRARMVVGSGVDLPFPTGRFTAVATWYVLEHLENPGCVLRELTRILKPDGLLAVKAQDARNGWEGHYKIPWMPFLSGSLADAWLEAFDQRRDPDKSVFEVTQPQIAAILENLGCHIAERAPDPQNLFIGIDPPSTPLEAKAAGMKIRSRLQAGKWHAQPENLFLFAVKR